MKRVLILFLFFLIVVLIGIVSYIKFALPNVGAAPELKVDLTPENIKKGKYIANHVAVCMDCHSTRDWTLYSGPITPGTEGKGGEYFGPEMGFPGKFYSKNLTPTNLQDWTDGEIYRAITTGVERNGRALFPVMPYHNYGKLDKEDVYSVIAYLRSLNPIENEIPKREIDFPMSFILNTIPEKGTLVHRPEKTESIKYGAYLVNMAACIVCHTPEEKGKLKLDSAFAGGRTFQLPSGTLRTANITQDQESGIGTWTEEAFLSKFKSLSDPAKMPKVSENEMNTIMPWTMYGGMDTADLKAIYTYLKTIKPIKNQVVQFKLKK